MHRAQGEADAAPPPQDVDEGGGGRVRFAQPAVGEGEPLADGEREVVRERHALGLGGGESREQPLPRGDERLRLGVETPLADIEVAGWPAARQSGEEAPGGLRRGSPEDAAEDPVQLGRAAVVVAHEEL